MSKTSKRDHDLRKNYKRRLAKMYGGYDPEPSPSEVRRLDGDALAARKAELEARGLPPTKQKTIGPAWRGKKFSPITKQVI